MTRTSWNGRRGAVLLAAALALGIAWPGCSSGRGEHAPRQSLPPTPSRDSVGEAAGEAAAELAGETTRPESSSRKPLLVPFVDEVAKVVKAQPGIVAVFPAFSPRPTDSHMHVNGLGDRLATDIADELRMAGINPLAGAELRNDILASNRSLGDLDEVSDVIWIAERLGVDYAIFGTVQKKVYDRIKRDEQLDINLQCLQLRDRKPMAQFRKSLPGGAVARDLYRDYPRPGSWKIGVEAPPFEANVDAEVKYLARGLLRKIATRNRQALEGKRITVEPAVICGVSGPTAGNLQAFVTSFLRALDQAEAAASQAGSASPNLTALDKGPVTLHGQEYPTLNAALEVIEQRRAALRTSRAGQLSIDLARLVAETLREEAGEANVDVLADDASRQTTLDRIKREAFLVTSEGAVDPRTVATLQAKGTQLVVECTLRPFMRSYQLRLIVLDAATGRVVASESADVEHRFKGVLDALTTG